MRMSPSQYRESKYNGPEMLSQTTPMHETRQTDPAGQCGRNKVRFFQPAPSGGSEPRVLAMAWIRES
jgi:hypothetical protein